MSVTVTPPAVRSFCLSPSQVGIPRFRMAVRSNVVTVAPILTKLQKDCATPLPLLRHVADSMAADMRAGLSADTGSDLPMILSYVDSLPTGYDDAVAVVPEFMTRTCDHVGGCTASSSRSSDEILPLHFFAVYDGHGGFRMNQLGRGVPFVFLEGVKDDFKQHYAGINRNDVPHPLADDEDDDNDLFKRPV